MNNIKQINKQIVGLKNLFPEQNFNLELKVRKNKLGIKAIDFEPNDDYDEDEDSDGLEEFQKRVGNKHIIKFPELVNYIR